MLADLTPAQIQATIDAANERIANGAPITPSTLAFELQQLNASWKSPIGFQSITLTSAVLSFERTGKMIGVTARPILGTTVTVTALASSGTVAFSEGDQVIIRPAEGFTINLQLVGMPATLRISQPTHYAILVYSGGRWSLVSSSPMLQGAIVTPPNTLTMTGSNILPLTAPICVVVNYTGETPAAGDVTINTAGTAGSITAYVDEGNGTFAIGSYTYAGSPSEQDIADGLAADINANFTAMLHEYDAGSVAGAVCQIYPPPGLGSIANSYTVSSIDTGDCASTPTGFSGGAPGTEDDLSIDEISYPATDGQVITIINGTSANVIDFAGPAVPGSNISAVCQLAAGTAGQFIYNAYLGRYSPLKFA